MKTKVYIVMSWYYDVFQLHGVFSTQEKANRATDVITNSKLNQTGGKTRIIAVDLDSVYEDFTSISIPELKAIKEIT